MGVRRRAQAAVAGGGGTDRPRRYVRRASAQVYREPAWVRFYAHPLSLACLFRILGSAACVVLAILATISSGDVWLKRKVGTYQAHVDFLYNAMIRVTVRRGCSMHGATQLQHGATITCGEDSSGTHKAGHVQDSTGTKTWTTDPAANQLLGAQSGLGMLQVCLAAGRALCGPPNTQRRVIMVSDVNPAGDGDG